MACPSSKEPVMYAKKLGEKQVLVISNDSTVFLTQQWVSAFEMFGGRLTEVKKLVERLEEVCEISFGIISGRYGFIPANYVIAPYDNVPEGKEEFEELQERTDFVGKIGYMCQQFFDAIIVCVPKDAFELLKDALPDKKVIAVTNPMYEDYCAKRGWTYIHRNGARVGNENADFIVEKIRTL